MDRSERRFHLGGPLGAQLAQWMLERRQLLRKRSGRALVVTDDGWDAMERVFGVPRGQLARNPAANPVSDSSADTRGL